MAVDNGIDPTQIDSWWVGYLAATIDEALSVAPLEGARFVLERSLKEFKRSSACTPAVAEALRKKGAGRWHA